MASSELPSRVADKAQQIAQKLSAEPELASLIDLRWQVPQPYLGSGEIRLFILGQDPTVKKEEDRAKIRTCLNLDRRGSMVAYLSGVCKGLGLELRSNVYATNYIKNFFVQPPTQIDELDVLQHTAQYWFPLLQEELESFPEATVISLGEPLLSILVVDPKMRKVRKYWGYTRQWQGQGRNSFSYIRADKNKFDRRIFPFPHQPSLRKSFYRRYMDEYIAFVADEIKNAVA